MGVELWYKCTYPLLSHSYNTA